MPRAKRAQVTKSESPVKPATSTSVEKRNGKSNANATGDLESTIRARAYELYVKRGCQDGFAQDDWLQAEAEVVSRFSRTA
jgi:DUF2934 family protein